MAFTLRTSSRLLIVFLLLVLPEPLTRAPACCFAFPQTAEVAEPETQEQSASPLTDDAAEATPQDAAPSSPDDSEPDNAAPDAAPDAAPNAAPDNAAPDAAPDAPADDAPSTDEAAPSKDTADPLSDAPPKPGEPAPAADAADPPTDRASDATPDLPVIDIDFLFDGKSPTSVEQLRAMETHFAQLADQVAPATVNIQIGMAQGSGVVVSRDGYILTAAHVIGRPALTATVTFPDGKKVKAKTLGLARRLDYGMLKILDEEGDRFPYLDMGYSAELKQGQWVMAVGHPGGIDEKRGLVFRAGRIIANSIDKLQTDCTLVGGDSGGPLVDMNGEVIGIHSRIGSKLWDNLHAPMDVYSENWDRMDKGLVIDGTPHLGFNVKPNTIRVTSVETDGPAKKAGIKTQDRIVEVNGHDVADYDDLKIAIAKLRPYQKVSFKVKRRSKVIEMEVVVREKP